MEWKDTCDAFGSQLDYEALVRCSKKKQALSKAYVEACTLPNGCLFDYRLDSMGDFQALFSLYPLEHLARATALQYFDAVLSKTFETRSDLPFHCLRLASKFIGGRDLNEVNDSEFKENLKDTTLGLSANETFLVTTLDWRLCSPTVYTLFHNLRQQNDLKYRNKVDDEVADKSIIDSLYDRYLLRFVPHHHASALVFHLCLVPQEKEEAVYFLCDKDDVNDCLMVINRKHSSDEEDVEDNENPSGGLTNGADATEEEQSDKQETESAEETNYDDTPDSSIEGYGFDASEEAAEEKDVDYGSDASEEEAEKQDVDIKNQFYDLKDSNIEDYGFDAYEEEQDVDYGSDASEEEAEEQDVDIKNQFYDLEGSDVDKMNEILKELHISCQRADGTEDEKKVTQLLELYEIEIQMYTEPKNNKKLKLLYQKALALNSAISQPRIVGIIHECGGKIHMAERQWVKAAANFFKAFKNYDEAGNQRRIPCLKYLILAYMLMQSEVNPIDGQEAKAYKNDPEILVMTDLIAAYQRNEILEFEKILKNNERTIKDEPFIRNHIEDLLKNVRTQALLNLIKPYTRIRIPFISKELNVPEADVEELLVSLILDNRVQGRIDQVNRLLECGDRSKGMKKYTAVDKWNTLVRSLYQ